MSGEHDVLSLQLEGLKSAQMVSSKASHAHRASLFLSASDAAGFDFDVVLEAALNGFRSCDSTTSASGNMPSLCSCRCSAN